MDATMRIRGVMILKVDARRKYTKKFQVLHGACETNGGKRKIKSFDGECVKKEGLTRTGLSGRDNVRHRQVIPPLESDLRLVPAYGIKPRL